MAQPLACSNRKSGGILTVADDLLKNDGQKFIDMMEQLAERRMQREEQALNAPLPSHAPLSSQHNHGDHNHLPPEEDDYDDEEDEDYDSQDEEYDEEDDVVSPNAVKISRTELMCARIL